MAENPHYKELLQLLNEIEVEYLGRTTSPEKVRKALRVKPGDKLQQEVEGDRARTRVHPGIRSLKGALASNKGKEMSFAEIREAAAEAVRPR